MNQHGLHSTLVRAVIMVTMLSISTATTAHATSFSPEDLKAALRNAGIEKVFKLQTFETPKSEYILVYGGAADGHAEILVLRDNSHRSGHADLKLDWRSGVLPKDLLVMSSGGPEIQSMVNGDTVLVMSGCAPHNCGASAGAMIYSMDQKELFKATYDSASQPPLKYSANALVDKNALYKHALDSVLQGKK